MKKNTQKIISILAAGAVATSLNGCNSEKKNNDTSVDATKAPIESIENNLMVNYTASGEEIYEVIKGDTLSSISKKHFGTEKYADALAYYNGIQNKNLIHIGDKIVIPNNIESIYIPQEVKEEKEEKDTSYIISSGDTLGKICMRFYGTNDKNVVWKLATYNNLSNPNKIIAGNSLNIPSYDKLSNVISNNYSGVEFDYYGNPCKPNLSPCHGHHNPYYDELIPFGDGYLWPQKDGGFIWLKPEEGPSLKLEP